MSQDWKIKDSARQCAGCQRPFVDAENIFSRLDFEPEQGYQRGDFCAACGRPAPGAHAVSVWQGVYHAPAPPKPEAVQKETAESLLRQLMETEEESNRNIIFILAVMLERKRTLIERDVREREDGIKLRVYEHRKSGETFLIPDPQLKLAELAAVQAEVVVRLGGRLPGAPAPAPAGPEKIPPPEKSSSGS